MEISVKGLNAKYFSESGIMQIEAEACSATEEERTPEKVWIQFSASELVDLYRFLDDYYETSILKNAENQYIDMFNSAPICPECNGIGKEAKGDIIISCRNCDGQGRLLGST